MITVHRDSGGDNELRHKLQLPSIPLIEFTIAATRDPDNEVEIRHGDDELSAISLGRKYPVCLRAALEIVNMPSIAIVMLLSQAVLCGKVGVNGC